MIEDHIQHKQADPAELATVDFPFHELDDEQAIEAAAIFRQAAAASMDFYRRLFMSIQDYRGDKAFAIDCAMLALGWHDLARAFTQQEIARRHKCDKANVNRLVNKIQTLVGVPPLNGQRSNQAREKFSSIRKQQLKPNENTN